MFIRKDIRESLELLSKEKNQPVDELIWPLQIGYEIGKLDFRKKFPDCNTDQLQMANLISTALSIALNYLYYTLDGLLDADNFE